MTRKRHGVAVFFVNRQGQVLLRERGDAPGLAFPNQWDTIGGAVELGETHAQAVERETAEEIGLDLRGHVYWRHYQSVVLLHIYAAPLDVPVEDLVLTEGRRIAWFTLEDALRQPLHPWVRAMLPEFLKSAVYRGIVDAWRQQPRT